MAFAVGGKAYESLGNMMKRTPVGASRESWRERSIMISVICSLYNGWEHLVRFFASLNEQTLGEFELIVVDAASDDGAWEFLEESGFREGITVVKTRAEERIGIYAAWNIAIEQSNHPWIVTYNVDDLLFPGALALKASYCERYPEVALFYNRAFVSGDAEHQNTTSILDPPEPTEEAITASSVAGPFPTVSREALREVGGFDDSFLISGDWEMWVRLCRKGHRFVKCPEIVGSYYRNPKGLSTRRENREIRMSENERIRRKYAL